MNDITTSDLDRLVSHTSSLINHVHYFIQTPILPPGGSHRGCAINTVDLQEQRVEFLRELRNTASNWVYSKAKYDELFRAEMERRGYDAQNAAAQIAAQVKQKFRPGYPQGQFGELLLFNFVQHFFKAAPLLRKMALTTNVGLERNGADAIHYCRRDEQHVIYIGEAKTYESKYSFKSAFEASIASIWQSYNNLAKELELYVYDDFIDKPLRPVARDIKDGKLDNVRRELVIVVAYNETRDKSADSEEKIKQQIEDIVKSRYASVGNSCDEFSKDPMLSRLHYIVFPIWGLDELLRAFERSL